MILGTTIFVAAIALTLLNFSGALALTGSWALATVLGCVAVAQWAAARQALVLARSNPDGRSGLARWGTVALLLLFYFFAAAWITVPLSAAKLDQLLGVAKEVQQTRFDEEQATIRRRAKEIGATYEELASRLRQLQAHALAMRDLEGAKGGSCLTSRGDKPGEIYRWREQEARLAGELVGRAAAPIATATGVVDTVVAMKLDTELSVREAERTLVSVVDDLNRLSQAPVLGTLREYVRQADESAREIQLPRPGGQPPEKFNCVDTQRTATLAGLLRNIETVQKLPALPKPLLMDASSGQDIAKAKLIGAWSVVLGALPVSQGSLVDPVLLKRYRMGEGHVLSGPRLSWGVAWALELLLLVLIALQINERGHGPGRREHLRGALADIALDRLAQQPGRLGSLASTWLQAGRTADASQAAQAASRPRNRLDLPTAPEFDAENAARWQLLYPHLVTVENTDYLLVPATDARGLAAAREAVLSELAKPMVQGLTSEELVRHPQIRANPAFAGHAPVDANMRWWLFRITQKPFAQYLLGCWRQQPGAA
jgi:hypothetical protein